MNLKEVEVFGRVLVEKAEKLSPGETEHIYDQYADIVNISCDHIVAASNDTGAKLEMGFLVLAVSFLSLLF